MGIGLICFAAICAVLSNLALRLSIDKGGTSQVYLVVQFSITCLLAIVLNPIRTGHYAWNAPLVFFGLLGGVLLAAFMSFLGKALEQGPPGLTIAILNSSTVLPILLLFLFLGKPFGFVYSLWNALGSLLVVIGLFWAGWRVSSLEINRRKWLLFACFSCALHTLYLIFLQLRVLFLRFPGYKVLGFSMATQEAASQWFMPMVFLGASIVQAALFIKNRDRLPKKEEVFYGCLGGLTGTGAAFLMIWSTEIATSLETAMLFPIFSVVLIFGCNLWGKWIYKETIHWKANTCAIAGIFLGVVDWAALFR